MIDDAGHALDGLASFDGAPRLDARLPQVVAGQYQHVLARGEIVEVIHNHGCGVRVRIDICAAESAKWIGDKQLHVADVVDLVFDLAE